MRRRFPESCNRSARKILLTIAVLAVSWSSSSVFALWLPWASDEKKVEKALAEVFEALVKNDRRTLNDMVKGNATRAFIDQEQEQIKALKVKQYECRIKRINIDQAQKSWAFIEYEKTATLANGNQSTTASSAVFRKINGEWKLLTGVKGKLSAARKEAHGGQRATLGEGGDRRAPETKAPLPGIQTPGGS
jgi:hypothetical protein